MTGLEYEGKSDLPNTAHRDDLIGSKDQLSSCDDGHLAFVGP